MAGAPASVRLARGLAVAMTALVAHSSGNASSSGGASSMSSDFAVVVDAGSSGSRVYVYELSVDGSGKLQVTGRPGKKVMPGLNNFENEPEKAGPYLLPLFAAAAAMVPPERHAATPIYIKSTAGMRLVPEPAQLALYDSIYGFLTGEAAASGDFPFPLPRERLGTIDGNMEAFYAVLSTNYLERRIDTSIRSTGHTAGVLGALDMGGASTQIIFSSPHGARGSGRNSGSGSHSHSARGRAAPRKRSHYSIGGGSSSAGGSSSCRSSLQLVPGDFWSHSYLSYGVQAIRERVWDHLALSHVQGREVANPCAFKHHREKWMGRRLVGTGDAARCAAALRAVMWPTPPPAEGVCVAAGASADAAYGAAAEAAPGAPCLLEGSSARKRRQPEEVPCPIDGVEMPPVHGDFYAMSAFFYALDCVRELGPYDLDRVWPRPTVQEVSEAVEKFCEMSWGVVGTELAQAHRFSREGLAYRCLEVVYMITLLRDGYGFPTDTRNITFALEAAGMEVEWTLGFMLAEVTSQMAPAALPEAVLAPTSANAAAALTVESCSWSERPPVVTVSAVAAPAASGTEDLLLSASPWTLGAFAALSVLAYLCVVRYAWSFIRGLLGGNGQLRCRASRPAPSGAAAASSGGSSGGGSGSSGGGSASSGGGSGVSNATAATANSAKVGRAERAERLAAQQRPGTCVPS